MKTALSNRDWATGRAEVCLEYRGGTTPEGMPATLTVTGHPAMDLDKNLLALVSTGDRRGFVYPCVGKQFGLDAFFNLLSPACVDEITDVVTGLTFGPEWEQRSREKLAAMLALMTALASSGRSSSASRVSPVNGASDGPSPGSISGPGLSLNGNGGAI